MSTVGATSVRLTKPSRCVVVERRRPGAKPGARTDATFNASRLLGGVGPSTITMSERSVWSSSRPTRRSVVSSAWARIRTACSSEAKRDARSARTRSEPSTNTTEPGLHESANRAHHAVGVEPDTERRGGVTLQQRGVDLPARHLAVACHQRRDRGAPPRRGARLGRARVRSVAVRDDTPGDAGTRQLVAEQAHLGAVQLAVVAVDGVGDRHVHQPVAGRDAGAGGEDVAGGVAPERLVDPEALAAGRAVRHRHAPAPRVT